MAGDQVPVFLAEPWASVCTKQGQQRAGRQRAGQQQARDPWIRQLDTLQTAGWSYQVIIHSKKWSADHQAFLRKTDGGCHCLPGGHPQQAGEGSAWAQAWRCGFLAGREGQGPRHAALCLEGDAGQSLGEAQGREGKGYGGGGVTMTCSTLDL